MKLVHISVGTKDSHMMNGAVRKVRAEGCDLDFHCYDASSLDEDPVALAAALKVVAAADMVTLKVHGDTSYFKKFGRLEKVLRDYSVCTLLECTEQAVTDAFRCLFTRSDEGYALCGDCLRLGGDENFSTLMKWCLREFDHLDIDVPEPHHNPPQGIYRPGLEDIDISRYIDSLDLSKPTVGIFFYQSQWVSGNTHHVDALIEEVESRGANAVPLFMYASEGKVPGAKGTAAIMREDLTRDGGPVLDSIIELMSFSQILVANPGEGEQVSEDNFFLDYGVPVIQSMTSFRSAERWKGDINGLTASEIAYDIAHPEFDGQIISVACGSTEKDPDGSYTAEPLEDRPGRVADLAVNWAKLRKKANCERNVAILLYMYPPKTANAGGASGLDTFQSVVDLLHRMRDDGYDVGDSIPETSRELVDMLLSGITNDMDWTSDEAVRSRALDLVPPDRYNGWLLGLPQAARERIVEGWGEPPGDFHTVGKDIVVPGIRFGRVLVSFQPDRGRDCQSDYHDPRIVMPHQYLAFYRWLRYSFGADAVVHVGTHGTLEWLPGKSVAMSSECCPDYVLDSVPDIYPYIIGNPGEGTQAKRRAAAVIVDHMIPAMARAGGYDDLEELEGILQRFMAAETQLQNDKREPILREMREKVEEMEIGNDLRIPAGCSDEELASRADDIYDYIIDLKENLIKDGLHVLGKVPEGDRMREMVYSLTRLDNGDIPSLRGAIARSKGYEFNDLLNDPSATDPLSGMPNGMVLDSIEEDTDALIAAIHEADYDTERSLAIAGSMFPSDDGAISSAVEFVCGSLHPAICRMGDEIGSIMAALQGQYIEPGPSGCPTRGRAQLLPTGRNFYSLDPDAIPWRSSWEVGRRMADQMLERHLQEHGSYPKSVGIVVWATDTMKTGGDDVAYILWLMGVRPVWTGAAGRVRDIEAIPIPELGRPRIDVTVRISGLFRDTFPNLVDLIDRAVKTISELDESDEDNCLRASIRADVVRSISEGIPEDRAREDASIRVFGDAPGTYGSGTNILIRTSDWKDVSDIGAIYRSYGEYAYGGGRKGMRCPEAFRRRLESMDVTVKNSVSREYDMLDNDDVYNDLGGLNAAVRSVSGRMPMSVIGCSADTSNVRTRTIDEEGRYVFRSKVLNPKWIEGLKPHGFKGAEEISNMAEYVFAWDATSGIVDPWMYQGIAERFLFDKENSEWLRDANPYAMHETVSWLLEAVGRGMWEPDDETRERLEKLYMELEGELEGME